MNMCGSCNIESDEACNTCTICKSNICPACTYYTRFYKTEKENGAPDRTVDEENHFCKTHFIEYVKGLSNEVLEMMLQNNFIIHGHVDGNDKTVEYYREFKGRDLREIITESIAPWPSDEWKDWNTM